MKKAVKTTAFIIVCATLLFVASSCGKANLNTIRRGTIGVSENVESGLNDIKRFTDVAAYRSGSFLRSSADTILNHVDFNEFEDGFKINQPMENQIMRINPGPHFINIHSIETDNDNRYLELKCLGDSSHVEVKHDYNGQDFLVEISLRPRDIKGNIHLLTLVDGVGNEESTLYVSDNGSVYNKEGERFSIDRLKLNDWNIIALKVHSGSRDYDIYINGRLILRGVGFKDNNFSKVTSIKVCSFSPENNGCVLDIDYAATCRIDGRTSTQIY